VKEAVTPPANQGHAASLAYQADRAAIDQEDIR
jgi:hypothetical protein